MAGLSAFQNTNTRALHYTLHTSTHNKPKIGNLAGGSVKVTLLNGTYLTDQYQSDAVLDAILSRCSRRVRRHAQCLLNKLKNARCNPPGRYQVPKYAAGMDMSESAQDVEVSGMRGKDNHQRVHVTGRGSIE